MFTQSRSLILFSNFTVALITSAASIVTSVVLSFSSAFNRFCINTYFSNFHDEDSLCKPEISMSLNNSGFVLECRFLINYKYACKDTTSLAPKAVHVLQFNGQAWMGSSNV